MADSTALDKIAKYYERLPKLIATVGRGNISPERVIEEIVSSLMEPHNNVSLRWCAGHGGCHFWLSPDRLASSGYDVRCVEPERRTQERRKS